MPVHFKGNSEYNTHYKWVNSYKSRSFRPTSEQAKPKAGLSSTSSEYKEHYKPIQSFKSASFTPSAEQIAPAAGQQSSKLGVPSEPPIQRKKRLDGPMTSLSTHFHQGLESPGSEDFALLGANEKFVENVKYTTKSRSASPPKQQKLAHTKKEKENRQEVSKPKPAPVVNTEMYRKSAKGSKSTMVESKPKTQESPKVPTPMAPREMKSMLPLQLKSELEAPKISTKSPVKSVKKSATSDMDANKQESLTKLPLKDKNINTMNESVQTNMERGIALSAPEAPAEFALKYKAGIAPPRPKKKVSEYQKSFDWKVGSKSSPLLAAEQVVYNSNPAVAPFKKDVVPKKSEYDVQFQNWKQSVDPPVQAAGKSSKKRSKVKRSKSVGAVLSPDKMAAAGSSPVITSDNKRLTKETPDVEVRRPPPIPHGQLRRSRSEYRNNFKAPCSFDYIKGAWRGANPPHLQVPEPDNESTNVAGPSLSNWFAEVIELRRKAQEYRKRAQGTHFSREHAVQLIANQADAWDIQSSARSGHSTLSALSLEMGSAKNGASRRDSARATMASDEQVEEQDLETEAEGAKLAWQENKDEDSVIASSTSTVEETDGGRVPTPKWQQKLSVRSGTRHHLDLTTPAVGGAILTSPPQKKHPRGKKAVSKSEPITLQDVDEPPVEQIVRKPIAGQTYTKPVDVNQGRIQPTPTFGMPSRDTHYLRDDDVSCDQPLQTNYVHSPLKKQVNKHWDVSIPATIKEGFGLTYNQPVMSCNQARDVDDDVLSVSARSVASSCSLASDTLERARKRKEEFWGKHGVGAH